MLSDRAAGTEPEQIMKDEAHPAGLPSMNGKTVRRRTAKVDASFIEVVEKSTEDFDPRRGGSSPRKLKQ